MVKEAETKLNRKHLVIVAIFFGILILAYISFRLSWSTSFPKEKYVELLNLLRLEGYVFVKPGDLHGLNMSCKVAVLIHDVDFNVHGVSVLSDVEREFGVRSCFYVRPESDYFDQSISTFKSLEAQGWEIGLHYQCLSRTKGNTTLALEILAAQICYLRQFFNVCSTHAHGDGYNLSIDNHLLTKNNPEAIAKLNVIDVWTYLEPYNFSYICDTNKVWSQPKTLNSVVLVNLHADWW